MIVKNTSININGDYAEINVIQNNKHYCVLIDKEDINKLINNSLIIDNTGYCTIRVITFDNNRNKYSVRLLLHSYILNNKYNVIDKKVCDHINQNKLDNRKCNLRIVSRRINRMNSNSKGYYYDKNNNRWRAFIKINGRYTYYDCNSEREAKEKREYLMKLHFPNIFPQ